MKMRAHMRGEGERAHTYGKLQSFQMKADGL